MWSVFTIFSKVYQILGWVYVCKINFIICTLGLEGIQKLIYPSAVC